MYLFLFLLTCISMALARNVGLEGDLYEGDIALKTSLPSNSSSSVKLAALRDASKIWPGGKVPYRIDKDSIPNEDNQHMIREVMESLSREVGCIEFQDNEQVQKFDSVRIASDGDKDHSSTGCWSYVGLQGGEQTLNLGSGCFTEALIYHELLHLLGIIHEQNRPDRDDFVEIIWLNIEPGKKGQFEKRNESEVKMQDTPYDFRSRMHYTADSFSKSDAPTIIARYPGNDNFGPLNKLSPTDIVEISLLYQCDIDSRTVVKYTHANRYANEVRIEQVWDEMEAVNSTIEDKFCQIDDKLKEMDTKLSSKPDQKNTCSEQLIKELVATNNNLIEKHLELSDYKSSALEEKIEMKAKETLIKVDSCEAQIQLIKESFEAQIQLTKESFEAQMQLIKESHATKNDLIDKNLELTDYKTTGLEEKIKEIDARESDHETELQKTNELLTSKDDKMEKQLNELIELFKSRNTEIEQLKEKTKKLEKENQKMNELTNKQKELISKMEKKLSKMVIKVDCEWSSWTSYSQCKCNSDGTKTRTRSIEQQSQYGGDQCTGGTFQTIDCSGTCAKVDCVWSSWSEYSQCSATYCGGRKTRTRTMEQQPKYRGAQCTGGTTETDKCRCDPVLLHTDNEYQYYKVLVPVSSKMTTALVLSTCTNIGMSPQCYSTRNNYADSNCVAAPKNSYTNEMPYQMSKILCNTYSPHSCAQTVNMFWYILNYQSGSACGATKAGSYCSTGNDYISTSSLQYFAACLKAL